MSTDAISQIKKIEAQQVKNEADIDKVEKLKKEKSEKNKQVQQEAAPTSLSAHAEEKERYKEENQVIESINIRASDAKEAVALLKEQHREAKKLQSLKEQQVEEQYQEEEIKKEEVERQVVETEVQEVKEVERNIQEIELTRKDLATQIKTNNTDYPAKKISVEVKDKTEIIEVKDLELPKSRVQVSDLATPKDVDIYVKQIEKDLRGVQQQAAALNNTLTQYEENVLTPRREVNVAEQDLIEFVAEAEHLSHKIAGAVRSESHSNSLDNAQASKAHNNLSPQIVNSLLRG